MTRGSSTVAIIVLGYLQVGRLRYSLRIGFLAQRAKAVSQPFMSERLGCKARSQQFVTHISATS
jgi:hypothetical protein